MHPHLYRLLAGEVLRDRHAALPLLEPPARAVDGTTKPGLVHASPRRTRRTRRPRRTR
jgi:hypothetical protein